VHILLLTNYFAPETVGSGIWITQMASELRRRGHSITVITSFPSYPRGAISSGYRNRWFSREQTNGIEVIRTYTYATPSKNFWPRVRSFGTFCASSALAYLPHRVRADAVYAILPPLPLGVSAWLIARASSARLLVNIQDLYPDVAVALGYLRSRPALWFFRWMERWIYRRSHRIVVVSEGFRQNLLGKGVPFDKIRVVPNWADPDAISPAEKNNQFRRELNASGEFLVLYSGGLTHNAALEPVLEAARILAEERIRFVIVGEGVQKEELVRRAQNLGLNRVSFLPFQPLDRYPEVLAAADLTLVTLSPAATFLSVPSKIFKQMAAARPILAITNPGSELTRLVVESGCGWAVAPDDVEGLVRKLREASQNPELLETMGGNGRRYLEQHGSLAGCVSAIEEILREL